MTTDETLDAIVKAEGGFQENPADRSGGATNYGITAQTLGNWRRLGRQATRAEVKALALEEARDIYRSRFVAPFESIPFDGLKATLVDTGVLSGPATAIRLLQGVLGVPVDGVLGDRTSAALALHDWRLVNAALTAARIRFFTQIVERDETQRVFYFGWCRRSVSFL